MPWCVFYIDLSIYLSTHTEEGIIRDTRRTEDCIGLHDTPGIVANTSNIARRANRVLQVANLEAENSEDPHLVQRIGRVTDHLKSCKSLFANDIILLIYKLYGSVVNVWYVIFNRHCRRYAVCSMRCRSSTAWH